MRAISTVLRRTNLLTRSTIKMQFSEQARGNGDASKVYQDWQYCKMITHELKSNNINQSLSLLFQSYFNNQILDIQIYHQIHQKITSANLPLSYAEIVYQVYRQHFPPHSLMTSWMQKLTYSKNEKLIEKLKKDYEVLGLTFSQRSSRAIKRQAKKQLKIEKVEENPVKQSSASRRSKNKKNEVPLPNIELPNIELSKTEQETPHQEIHTQISSQIRDALKQLSLDINSFSRIIVHDLQINFNNENIQEEGEQQYNSEEQEQQGDGEIPNLGLYGLDLSQIKIGKVEFINDKPKEQ